MTQVSKNLAEEGQREVLAERLPVSARWGVVDDFDLFVDV